MQFTLFLYDDQAFHDMPEDRQMQIVGEYMAFGQKLQESGAMVSGEPLAHSRDAKTLRSGSVEDGPYAATKEQLGGFYVIEVDSFEIALDWARQTPTHRHGGHVEVRPIPNYAN